MRQKSQINQLFTIGLFGIRIGAFKTAHNALRFWRRPLVERYGGAITLHLWWGIVLIIQREARGVFKPLEDVDESHTPIPQPRKRYAPTPRHADENAAPPAP